MDRSPPPQLIFRLMANFAKYERWCVKIDLNINEKVSRWTNKKNFGREVAPLLKGQGFEIVVLNQCEKSNWSMSRAARIWYKQIPTSYKNHQVWFGSDSHLKLQITSNIHITELCREIKRLPWFKIILVNKSHEEWKDSIVYNLYNFLHAPVREGNPSEERRVEEPMEVIENSNQPDKPVEKKDVSSSDSSSSSGTSESSSSEESDSSTDNKDE